ncbi:MAG: type IV toxin-antitoxin system AbiEi family antitoxin [Shinella sp.]|nr:type IV toxin-antitoxin system AbiEi family antitoxin [Shinella sp.]
MPNHLSAVLDAYERSGKLNVRAQDLRAALPDISDEGLRKAVYRQQERGRLVGLSQGSQHWLIVPLQHANAGAPPLEAWLHQYMSKTLATPYYVAMLSAAETYGASPYAVMVTQVMVPERRRSITVGRHQVSFHTRTRIERMPTRWHETPDGRFKVSTPELTVLDIIQHMATLGGIGRVREVLRGMWAHCAEGGFSEALDALQNAPIAQRLGVLMELDGQADLSRSVKHWLRDRPLRLVALDGKPRQGRGSPDSRSVDAEFKVRIPADLRGANT